MFLMTSEEMRVVAMATISPLPRQNGDRTGWKVELSGRIG